MKDAAIPERSHRNAIADRNTLVERHLILARWVANKYFGCGLSRAELQQAAMIGLMEAADRFDATRGTRFSTYAVHWCKREIIRTIQVEVPTIRIPIHHQNRLCQRARAEKNGQPLPEPSKLEGAALRARWVTSIDWGTDEDRSNHPTDCSAVDPASVAENTELTELLDAHVASLPHPLQSVARRCFGLGCEQEPLTAIASSLGLSRERVRQLRTHALRILKQRLGRESCWLS